MVKCWIVKIFVGCMVWLGVCLSLIFSYRGVIKLFVIIIFNVSVVIIIILVVVDKLLIKVNVDK